MEEYVGHIAGDSIGKIVFIADSLIEDKETQKRKPQRITMGEMFIAVDDLTEERFLLRVTDIGYGQKPEVMKESARMRNKMLSRMNDGETDLKEKRFTNDKKDRMYFRIECELVGFINHNGKFGPPKHLPSYDSPVRRLNEKDMDFMKDYLGDIPFGKLRSGGKVLNMPVGLFAEAIPYHMAVFARTGGGKSNFLQVVLAGLLETEGVVGSLLFEPHGDYKKKLINHPFAKDNLVIFTNKGTSHPLERKLRISWSDLRVNDLMSVRHKMHWSEPQERFLRQVEAKLGRDWFRYLVETPVSVEDEMTMGIQLGVYLKDDFPNTYEDTIRVTQSKLNNLKNLPFFTRDSHVSDINEILTLLNKGKTVLIDTFGVKGAPELLLSSLLSTRVLENRESIHDEDFELLQTLPPIAILLEEAPRVLSKEAAGNDANIFATLGNEGRKYRVGLLIVAQQPKKIDNGILSQINTLCILGINDEKDFLALKEVSAKPIDNLKDELKSLEVGEMIFITPKIPYAVSAKVDFYDDYFKNIKAKTKPSSRAKKDSFGLM